MHCCWISGAVCPFLIESAEPRFKWACSLRALAGNWGAAYATVEYRVFVRPALTAAGIAQDCGDWPGPGKRCNDCGEVG